MDEHTRAKIKDIKTKVVAMLEERQLLASGGKTTGSPSEFWADSCSKFDYMLGLPEESFSKLRLHTYHFTVDTYFTYMIRDWEAEAFRVQIGLDALTEDIPSRFVLNEPEGGIGFSYSDGRFVSHDTVKFQRIVNTLYRRGILSELLSKEEQQRNFAFEIGAGYGGLAHHLSNIFRNTTYVIVDIPEAILFSAAYLSLLNPHKKLYLYDKNDFFSFVDSEAIGSYHYILIPNYRLQSLHNWRFDIAINTFSFQEMRNDQVDEYLDFIRETCVGVLYSLNKDCHQLNRELSDLSAMLNTRFALEDVRKPQKTQEGVVKPRTTTKIKLKIRGLLRSIAILIGLLDRPQRIFTARPQTVADREQREYICKPLPKNVPP